MNTVSGSFKDDPEFDEILRLGGEARKEEGIKNMPDTINFYSVSDEYGVFSNFAQYPIELDGKTWPTSEHYFQAQKFRDDAAQVRFAKQNHR